MYCRFRWVTCQLDQLKTCLDADEIDTALKSLPLTLGETYLRILKAIPTQHKRKTIRLLQLLIGARRSLMIRELVDAVAVETDSKPYFDPAKRMPKFEEITHFCSSLVEVRRPLRSRVRSRERWISTLLSRAFQVPKYPFVELAHSSVKSFLTSAHLSDDWAPFFRPTAVHASIATICLCYTISLDKSVHTPWVVFDDLPFESYSARYWPSHAIAADDGTNDIVLDLALKLLLLQKEPYKRWWAGAHLNLTFPRYYEPKDSPPTALYAGCRIGWVQLVASLLKTGADPNYDDPNYPSPAYAACRNGNKDIVQLLISKGADFSRYKSPNHIIRGGPLQFAVRGGHHDVVLIVLDHLHESNISSRAWNEIYGHAIVSACNSNNLDLVHMLLTDLLGNESFDWDTRACNPLSAAVLAKGACLHDILDHLRNAGLDTQTWFELLQGGFEFTHPQLNDYPKSPALHQAWTLLKTQADSLGFVVRGTEVFKNYSDSEGTII